MSFGFADAVTPTDLLGQVRGQRSAADQAEAAILELAVEWAHAHPVLTDAGTRDGSWHSARASAYDDGAPDPAHVDLETYESFGIPEVRWDAPAAFAVANAMSTTAGKALIRDALVLRHRLPRMWARVRSGEVPAWRARRVAQAVLGAPVDVVAHIDATLADIAHQVGPVTLDRLLDEAMLRLHPEQRELERLEALDLRHATLDERTLNHTGIAEMILRGEWLDLKDFDNALSDVAAALAHGGNNESLDVRRSLAVGVLAYPQAAAALLADRAQELRPRRHLTVVVHLSEAAIHGLDPVGRNETTARPTLEQQIRDWAGRTDTHLRVLPVIDLHDQVGVDAYEIPDRLHLRVGLRDRTCVFPWCARPTRLCDTDHITPHHAGGQTTDQNLAALCRHHHRLKTHAGWAYTPIEPGTYLWRDPHGQQLLRDAGGTRDVTPSVLGRSPPPPILVE